MKKNLHFPQFQQFAEGQGFHVRTLATVGDDWWIIRLDTFTDDGQWEATNFRLECDDWRNVPDAAVAALVEAHARECAMQGKRTGGTAPSADFMRGAPRGVLWVRPSTAVVV